MAAKLELTLFGGVDVLLDGHPVTGFRYEKARALLFYLAVMERPHARTALAGLLWGDMPETNARVNLSQVLSDLRRRLGAYLSIDRQTIAFNRRAAYRLDVEEFEAGAGERPQDATTAALQDAVALYRGDFLDGFYVRNAPAFEEWVLGERRRLRELAVQALQTLADRHSAQGSLAEGIAYSRQLLHLEPWREEAHRQLMLLLARNGQRSAALDQFQTCKRALADELDVAPADETIDLHARIQRGEFDPEIEYQADDDRAIQTNSHNLPAQITLFVGRAREVSELVHFFRDPVLRLVTILGPGGIGKTRLALEVAGRLVDEMSHGLFFVSLAQLRDATHIVPAIADALGFQFHADERSTKEQLVDYLHDREVLLVLDNFEHLLAGVDLVQELLHACAKVRLLVTSRERLLLMGETVFTLGSMEFPTWETPADAQEYSAVQLFCQHARHIRPGGAFHTDDLQYVVRICRLVGGMPLGIILAATWVEVLSPQEIATELTHGFGLLETQLRDLPERQRSMGAVLAYSWRRLDEVDRDVFMRLSVFRGGFTRDAAQVVAGATLNSLVRLVEKSFIQRLADGRYDIHELLRQYGVQRLAAAGLEQETEAAHSTYYLAYLQGCEQKLAGPDQLAVIAALEVDFENIRTAWQWAVQAREYALVDGALEAFFRWIWLVRNRQHEANTLMRMAREAWTPAPGIEPNPVWGRILARVLDVQNKWLVNPDQALARVNQALTIAGQHDNKAEVALCLWMIGLAYLSFPNHNWRQALPFLEESLQYYRAEDEPFHISQLLQYLGHCHESLWELEKAQAYYQQAYERCQVTGNKIGLAYCLSGLGWVSYRTGRMSVAADYWLRESRIRGEINDRQGVAHSLFESSLLALTKGDWLQGQQHAEQALSIAQDIGSIVHERWAAREIEIADAMAESSRSFRPSQPDSAGVIPPQGIALFFVVFGFDEITPMYRCELGRALRVTDRESDLALFMPFAAKLLVKDGDPEGATRLLALGLRYPEVAEGWVGRLPDIVDLQQRLRGSLPTAVFERSWVEGQDMDMETAVEELRTRLPSPYA